MQIAANGAHQMKIIQAERRPRIILSAVALATAALVTLVSQAASARPVTPAAAVTKTGSARGSSPSIVLAHGPRADSSSRDAAATRRHRDGYTAYRPPTPLPRLAYDP